MFAISTTKTSTNNSNSVSMKSRTNHGTHRMKIALCALVMGACVLPAQSDLTFVQTVDGWFTNTYVWAAQVETIVCLRSGDPEGTVRSVWGRVVQKNGSKVGTAVFCTTMTKVDTGLTDRWDVNVPAGMITDNDFWDASVICFELVECDRRSRLSYRTDLSPYGSLAVFDYPGGELDPQENNRYVSIDASQWNGEQVQLDGFDFAVYAYLPEFGLPIILNHIDEIGLSTFFYDELDPFGTGQPYDPNRLQVLGIDLDPTWDIMPKISDGLNEFEWQLFPEGGLLLTDQGKFQILQAQPLADGWVFICPADMDEDGQVNFFDVSLYLNLFQKMDPAADFNADGQFNFFDVSAFLDAYGQECPF
jgi:hypothetical protein